jgi:hypothetical protein
LRRMVPSIKGGLKCEGWRRKGGGEGVF